MASIKQLAGQTMWYGLSSVAARFLNYLLTFLHVYLFGTSSYGDVAVFYANAALLNILFTYGMETTFFRYVQQEDKKGAVYSTGFISLLITTLMFSAVLVWFRQPIADFMKVGEHPEWITWLALIVAADTLVALPFALLRQQNRPRKYAAVRIANILLTIGLQLFFFWIFPKYTGIKLDIGYVFLANLIASVATMFLLAKEFLAIDWSFDKRLWKDMIRYSMPLIIVGFGGMINETIDRQLLLRLYEGTVEQAKSAVGIYSANYKLAILIVLFIQAFRMGAEPFFFQQSREKNAPATYARVMKFFVIACCICFLFIVLFLDIWKEALTTTHKEYALGIMVVPILALSKVFLGIYYNLSIWYKLTDRNTWGAAITLTGAAITILVNILLIPLIGFFGSAIATLCCYAFMMISSFALGQKYYPIPYAWKKLTGYILICVFLFGIHQLARYFIPSDWAVHGVGLFLLVLFLWFISKTERKEFGRLPLIGKFFGAPRLPEESATSPNYP
ncbi:MAG TPA: oligosaccharide flippase family protein [Flavisolibacter sp.]